MKYSHLFLLLPAVIFSVVPAAPAGDFVWAKRFGGEGSDDVKCIRYDQNGRLYLVGSFDGTTRFGSQTMRSWGGRDAFVGRFQTNGEPVWVQQAGGTDDDTAAAVAVSPGGGIVVLGASRSATIVCGNISLTNSYARDYDSLFIARYDADGKALWARLINGAGVSDRAGIGCDAAGNIYFTAWMARFANFGVTNLTGYEDILVGKFNEQGDFQWARKVGSYGYDYGNALAVSPGGTAYVLGTFEYDASFDNIKLTSRGSKDVFLAAYNPDGGVEWAQQFGGPALDGAGDVVLVDPVGVLVSGQFTGSATVGDTNLVASTAYDPDLFLALVQADGAIRWVRQIGGIHADSPGGLAGNVTWDGQRYYTNLFMSGLFNDITTVAGTSLTNTASQTAYITQWDVQGQMLWVQQTGGNTWLLTMDQAPQPNLFVAGAFAYPSGWGVQSLLSVGNNDAFLAKLQLSAPGPVSEAPKILSGPQNTGATMGVPLHLEVLVSGNSPLGYRWFRNGKSLGDYNRVYGSATARLNVNSAQTNDAGNYTVVITNLYGATTSAVAEVTIAPAGAASGPDWSFVRTIGGNRSDSASSVVADRTGNVYVTGVFGGTNVIGTNVLIARANAQNIFLAKYDAHGLPTWARQAGNEKIDTSSSMAIDGADRLLLAGCYTSSNITFGATTLYNAKPGNKDGFVAQFGTDGQALWAIGFGGDGDDRCNGVSVDSDNNVYLVGDFESQTFSLGPLLVTNVGGQDVLVAKLDARGNVLWAQTAGYSGFHEGTAIAVDSAQHVYVTGQIWGRIRFGTKELDSHFDDDMFLAKYESSGQLTWARQMGCMGIIGPRDLAVDRTGNPVVSGYFNTSCPMDQNMLISHGSQDAFLAKFDPSGKVLWAVEMGGPGMDDAKSLAVDGANRLLVCGSFDQTMHAGDLELTTGGQRDVFFVLFDENGTPLWAKQAGGTRSDDGYAVAVCPDGSSIWAGSINSSGCFDQATYPTVEYSADAFLARLGGPSAPASVRLEINSSGQELLVHGTVGKTVVIQGAAELKPPISWTTWGTFLLTQSQVSWPIPLASLPKRYYFQAILQP
jgi:hypothetical protein